MAIAFVPMNATIQDDGIAFQEGDLEGFLVYSFVIFYEFGLEIFL